MSNKKKLVLVLGLISLLVTLNMIDTTYGKYLSKTASTTKMNVARWDIKVNNEHIKNSQDLEAEITPEYLENEYVAANTIAPGSVGYFDIEIDPSDTDVSFDYQIMIAKATQNPITDLKLLKYYINDENNMVENVSSNTITSSILQTNKQIHRIRIYVIWEDSTNNETLDNDQDSDIGHNAEDVSGDINISMRFTQKK